MDYYQTLGVNKNADGQSIKGAYRKLASKHHPDKGGDAEQFKKIQEAYDTLSDIDKRREYDNPSPFNGGNPFGDIFGDIFGQRAQQPQRNPDQRIEITIPLKDAYFGNDYVLNTPAGTVNFTVPIGTGDGDTYRMAGKGHHRFSQLPPGDLMIRVRVDFPPEWNSEGKNLFVRIGIDAVDAIVGSDITFYHINDKQYKLRVPAGCQQGQRIKMRGLGMPDSGAGLPGDLIAIAHIEVPTIHDEEVIKVLNTIKDLRGQNGK